MVMEKNIALAIQKEGDYIYDKVNNNDVELNIYDYLADAGYTDLEEYRNCFFCPVDSIF
jgi:hypothetical protein